MRQHLIVYAKSPLPGHPKTRLAAAIGEVSAAGVYARLLYAYLLDLLDADLVDVHVELAVAAPADVPFFAHAFPELAVRVQVAGDLGTRMAASFAQAFDEGADIVVLTGSDIPDLDSQIIRDAFQELETAPVVIGPASDGGYYLIGMRASDASLALFDGIEWSSERVLAQTEAQARAQGLALSYLPEHFDIDYVEEFERWRALQIGVQKKAFCSDD